MARARESPGRLRGVDAALAGLQPDEELQGAFGVGASAFRDEEHVEPLAGNAEQAGELRLFTATLQGLRGGGSEFVPQGGVGAWTKGAVTAPAAAFALEFSRGRGGGLRGGDESIGERDQLVQSTEGKRVHPATLLPSPTNVIY